MEIGTADVASSLPFSISASSDKLVQIPTSSQSVRSARAAFGCLWCRTPFTEHLQEKMLEKCFQIKTRRLTSKHLRKEHRQVLTWKKGPKCP
jgi:hypothetical protein